MVDALVETAQFLNVNNIIIETSHPFRDQVLLLELLFHLSRAEAYLLVPDLDGIDTFVLLMKHVLFKLGHLFHFLQIVGLFGRHVFSFHTDRNILAGAEHFVVEVLAAYR